MHGKNSVPILLILFFPLVLSACSVPITSNIGLSLALMTFTPDAELSSADQSEVPTATTTNSQTNTATPTPTPTATPTPSETVTTTQTHTVTSSPTSTNTEITVPCNQAEFISDVNYPDGSSIYVGTSFDKTWRVENVGSCTWTSDYTIVFDSGYRMGAPYSTTFISGDVLPGETVDITLSFVAPETEGSYRGSFFIRSPDGDIFGVGSSGTTAFWVKIYTVDYYSTATPTPVPTRHLSPPRWPDPRPRDINRTPLPTPDPLSTPGIPQPPPPGEKVTRIPPPAPGAAPQSSVVETQVPQPTPVLGKKQGGQPQPLSGTLAPVPPANGGAKPRPAFPTPTPTVMTEQ